MELSRLLLGEKPGYRRRYGAVAVVFGLLAALVPIGARVSGVFGGPGGDTEALGLTLLLLLVSGILALALPIAAGYHRAGLAVCIAIPTSLVLGLNFAYWTSVDTLRWTLWQWGDHRSDCCSGSHSGRPAIWSAPVSTIFDESPGDRDGLSISGSHNWFVGAGVDLEAAHPVERPHRSPGAGRR